MLDQDKQLNILTYTCPISSYLNLNLIRVSKYGCISPFQSRKLFNELEYSQLLSHSALQIGAVIALVADYLVWLDRTQIWVQNSLNKNGSNVADLYAALRWRMRTTAAGSHSTSPDQELHIYVGSVQKFAARVIFSIIVRKFLCQLLTNLETF